VNRPLGESAAWRWAPIVLGLLAAYLPTGIDQARTSWRSDELAHGPLIALAVAWLLWRSRDAVFPTATLPRPALGAALLAAGLALYVLGRSQQIPLLEVGSLIPVAAGLLLAFFGARALRAAAFPLFFLVFMLPLPGVLLEAVQTLLKAQVSELTEHILYAAGLPVARRGVLLTVGQYHLLMADACSGLHSMISLAALGVLFVHLVGRAGRVHNALLLASILPIAFAANVARVLVLALLTYHFGDQAGQGYLHAGAGFLLFAIALGSLMTVDALLARALGASRAPRLAAA
jgi:exosortase B